MISLTPGNYSWNVTEDDGLISTSWTKGNDSENIHKLIHDTLDSGSLIPVRNRKRKRISRYYRRRLALSFDEEKYHQRNKVETLQIKEIKIKVILRDPDLIYRKHDRIVSSGKDSAVG
jgi:hypothetical protein